MKTLLKIYIVICLFFPINSLVADTVCGTATCGDGQYCEGEMGCTVCPPGSYCPGGQKQDCPSEHANSEEGSTTINQCYRGCTKGNNDALHAYVEYKEEKVFYPNYCSDPELNNISKKECYNTDNECDGYHLDINADCKSNPTTCECVPNKKSCTAYNSTTGFQVWKNNAYSQCYVTHCSSGEHFATEGTICNTTYGLGCEANEYNCADKLTSCNGDSRNISGKIIWQPDKKKYSYDGCKCTTKFNCENGNGQCQRECTVQNPDTPTTEWNCKDKVASCSNGYCIMSTDETECKSAPKGYYYDGVGTPMCKPCPVGSTSAGQAGEITDCYITATTKFCDKNGCFSLPITTETYFYFGR